MKVNGGNGFAHTVPPSTYHGGGGSGGRLAVYFNRNRTYSGTFEAYGGRSGGVGASVGGAGTVFLYHKLYKHRTLQISNRGAGKVDGNQLKITEWTDRQLDPSRTWVITDSAHRLAKDLNYHFEELQLNNDAHLAFHSKYSNSTVSIYFRHMIGDRSGTLHIGGNQSMDLNRAEIDLPFTVRVYKQGHIGLAPMTFVHGVKIYNHGLITRLLNITLHHGGEIYFYEESRAGNSSLPNDYVFNTIRAQAGGLVRFVSSPVTHTGMNLTTTTLYIEGGGKLLANDIRVLSVYLVVDSGGHFSSDGLGYKLSDGTGKRFSLRLKALH